MLDGGDLGKKVRRRRYKKKNVSFKIPFFGFKW
jgi:hypothetical protein